MGRPRKHENRQQSHVAALLEKGGSRRTFLLSPEATKGLQRWRDRIGAKSDKEAVEQAILTALLHVRAK